MWVDKFKKQATID